MKNISFETSLCENRIMIKINFNYRIFGEIDTNNLLM